ncbi:MAG: carboxy terminal-processing peptidase, partial [Gammaproteobacteria bacterium]|nr:carboxy terminal-processing peptidase [Gammaproteobacteria bacterium]
VEFDHEGRNYKLGVITIPSFYIDLDAQRKGDRNYKSTTRDVRRLIKELQGAGVDGIVIDLRNNGGGSLQESIELTGLFIKEGPVVQQKGRRGAKRVEYDPDPEIVYEGPLSVIVNRYSASASEIVAAAMQDYARGVIIGQQTFGKGTVQNLYSLDQYVRRPDEAGLGQLTLTIGKYYRVTGESTQHRGVKPDIALPSSIDTELVGESVRETALPWDTIRTTKFQAGAPLDSTISSLMASHNSRSKDDPDYQYLMAGIHDIEQVRTQKSVSLNIEVRRAERKDEINRRLDRENARRAALQLEPVATLEELEALEPPDVHLDQAAAIVTDLAQLREIDVRPAQTAQVRP